MKLLFDLSSNKTIYDGVTIYALRILKGFKEHQYKNIIILSNPAIYEYIQQNFAEYIHIKAAINNENGSLLKNGWIWFQQIRHIDCDIIFSPNPYLTYFTTKKIIQTIHDLQALKVYKGKSLWAFRILLPFVLIRSHKIISITDFVKNEIKQRYPFINSKKIQTIANCVIVDKTKYTTPPINNKYLLYVSTLWEYKNIFTLLEAFNFLKKDIPHKLVIIGKPMDEYWENVCIPYIKKEKLETRIIHINKPISNQELAQYYQFADIFIHPSLMEGFGYTPIEAAIHETPVLTTKETALYESTMGLLNYYEPATSSDVLATNIQKLLANRPTKKELEHISETLLNQYDYYKQAEKVYNFLLTNSNDYNESIS